MALRYRQLYIEEADAIDPLHWVGNMQEYAEEFNGMLDQDNLREGCIGDVEMEANSCNELWGDYHADPTFAVTANPEANGSWFPDMTTPAWQRADTGGIDLASKQFTTDYECQITVKFGASWYWSPDALELIETGIEDTLVQFRLMVDGVVVGESGEVTAALAHGCTWVIGTTPAVSGSHDVWVEMRLFQRHSGIENPWTVGVPQYGANTGNPITDPDDWDDTVSIGIRSLVVHARYR